MYYKKIEYNGSDVTVQMATRLYKRGLLHLKPDGNGGLFLTWEKCLDCGCDWGELIDGFCIVCSTQN